MKVALFSFYCVISMFWGGQCSRILTIFNFPSKSHHILGVKLAEGLIKRGHHVTMASPFINDPIENFTQIHLRSILEHRDKSESRIANLGKELTFFFTIMQFCKENNELFWKDPGILKIIEEKPKYDVVIILGFLNDAILGIPHHLGVPSILFTPLVSNSLGNKYIANPNMVYVSNPFISTSTNTFFGRLFTVTANCLMEVLNKFYMVPFQEEILRTNLPNAPPLQDLQKNISLMLVNSHYSIEPPRPYVPNMIQVGGFHLQDTKELPTDIKTYLDGAKQGAILFCMGSNVLIGSIEKKKLQAIFKVLGEMAPMKILFKSELDHQNLPSNIKLFKWLPQADILAHPNIKVFISHGGLGGNTEAVYHGVPILGIPFYGDQKLNLALAKIAGYAAVVFNENLTEELFRNELKKVLEVPKYSQNAKMRSALIKDQSIKPMDNAAFWIEHIIKYGGGNHLKNAGMDLTWYEFYMIDIYVFYTIAIFLFLTINFYAIKFILRFVNRLIFESNSKIKTS